LIDNSNISIGAKKLPELAHLAEGLNQDHAMRLCIPNLTRLLCSAGRRTASGELDDLRALAHKGTMGELFVAGSRPPSTGAIWEVYKANGFTVKVLARDEHNKEEAVDSVVHAVGLQLLADAEDREDSPGTHTLVLCTGDGGRNDGKTSFPKLAFSAARHGWRVEVWSWASDLSGNFQRLSRFFPDGRVTIHLLDHFREYISFRQGEQAAFQLPASGTGEISEVRAAAEAAAAAAAAAAEA
jgi:hypothetical protein